MSCTINVDSLMNSDTYKRNPMKHCVIMCNALDTFYTSFTLLFSRMLNILLVLFPPLLPLVRMQKHFTATAFVVDSHGRTLLLWHKRLERWMPPGGHIDPDETPEDAARRECKEETGLDVDIVGAAQPDLFVHALDEGRMLKAPIALLLENIPASPSRGEPAHQHMDFLFLARPIDESQVLSLAEAEGSDLRWFTRDDVAALRQEEIFANVRTYVLDILPDHLPALQGKGLENTDKSQKSRSRLA